jgi:hypothetical protein
VSPASTRRFGAPPAPAGEREQEQGAIAQSAQAVRASGQHRLQRIAGKRFLLDRPHAARGIGAPDPVHELLHARVTHRVGELAQLMGLGEHREPMDHRIEAGVPGRPLNPAATRAASMAGGSSCTKVPSGPGGRARARWRGGRGRSGPWRRLPSAEEKLAQFRKRSWPTLQAKPQPRDSEGDMHGTFSLLNAKMASRRMHLPNHSQKPRAPGPFRPGTHPEHDCSTTG